MAEISFLLFKWFNIIVILQWWCN